MTPPLNVVPDLVSVAFGVVRRDINPADRPGTLFHFTDISGFLGISRGKALWASEAAALNDPSEAAYGVELADELLSRDDLGGYPEFCRHVRYYLDPANSPSGAQLRWRAYVTSFCQNAESALHWLHYGRSGTGVALGFDSFKVVQPPFELVKVIYDPVRQQELVADLVRAVIDKFERLDPGGPLCPSNYSFGAAAHMTAQALRACAPRFKLPAFETEQEWRLVSHELEGVDTTGAPEAVDLPTQHRIVGSRIVGYWENTFAALPVTEIILGWSCDTGPDNPMLRALFGEIPVSRSTVPLRP